MKRYLFIVIGISSLMASAACASSPRPVAEPTATLAPNIGSVFGVLKVRSGESAEPVSNVTLFLAETVKDSTGEETLVGFDRVNSPRTLTNNEGRFVFSNVPPRKYGLVLDAVVLSSLLLKPDSGEAMVIEVFGGQETDMGTLLYDFLPVVPRPGAYPYP